MTLPEVVAESDLSQSLPVRIPNILKDELTMIDLENPLFRLPSLLPDIGLFHCRRCRWCRFAYNCITSRADEDSFSDTRSRGCELHRCTGYFGEDVERRRLERIYARERDKLHTDRSL